MSLREQSYPSNKMAIFNIGKIIAAILLVLLTVHVIWQDEDLITIGNYKNFMEHNLKKHRQIENIVDYLRFFNLACAIFWDLTEYGPDPSESGRNCLSRVFHDEDVKIRERFQIWNKKNLKKYSQLHKLKDQNRCRKILRELALAVTQYRDAVIRPYELQLQENVLNGADYFDMSRELRI